MFGLDLPRCGLLAGVAFAHASVAFAFLQMRAPERPRNPVMIAETLFFSEQQQAEPPPTPPVVKVQFTPLRFDTSVPQLTIDTVSSAEMPPSATAPTAVAGAPPVTDYGHPVAVETVQYVQAPRPRYPPLSRRLKEQGVVVLKVLVNERGEAQRIEVADSSGHERLDRAAVEAVAAATFRPLLENGVPRAMMVLIPIEFGLHRART